MTDAAGLAGRLTPAGHMLPVRVYWEDTDAGGIVYHAAFLRFMERGRTDHLRLLGVDQSGLAAGAGVRLVVTRMVIDFVGAARLDDVLEVATRFGPVTGARIALEQAVTGGGRVLVRADVTVAAIDPAGRARRIPADIARLVPRS